MKWTKESAIEEFDRLIRKIDNLKEQTAGSAEHTRWVLSVSNFLHDIFGEDPVYYELFLSFTWEKEGPFFIGGIEDPLGAFNPAAAVDREHHKAYLKQLERAKGILLSARDQIEHEELEKLYRGKDTAPETSLILRIISLSEYKLRKMIRLKPKNEKQIQDAFEGLLIGADISYSRETDSIEYSSKTYRPDFSIQKSNLAIEIKICGRTGREKEIIAEINDDILGYKQKYGNLFFIVYDTGFIRDIEKFVGNFEDQEGVIVKVVKH